MRKVSKPERLSNKKLLQWVKTGSCAICYKMGTPLNPIDPSHIKSKGSGGPDTHWNVLPMCREHHNMWHRLGVPEFLKRFPALWWKLKSLGWERLENGRLWHSELTPVATDEAL